MGGPRTGIGSGIGGGGGEPPQDPPDDGSTGMVPSPNLDPDAELEESRAPLLDHLLELRSRVVVILIAVGIGFVGCFVIAKPIYAFLLGPFQDAAAAVADDRGLAPEQLELIFTQPLGYFFVQLKVAFFGAIIVAFPVIAYQVYAFVAPGLYKTERRAVLPFLCAAPVLFVLGMTLVYSFILPFVMRFALNQEQVIDGQAAINLLPDVGAYLSLVTTLMLAFGFSFQMPVALALAARAGLLGVKNLINAWRYAVVAIFVFAAFATPPDPLSQIGLGLALMGLYGVSILVVGAIERDRKAADAAAEAAAE